MGNSGSVHQMQSGMKELHSYYQVQAAETSDDFPYLNNEPKHFYKEQNCLERQKSLLRSKSSRIPSSTRLFDHLKTTDKLAKTSQVKVLPNLNENRRLRSTTNGAILQSGGTISGRKDPPQTPVLERSKTLITENSRLSVKDISVARSIIRRSQTQLNYDLSKESGYNPVHKSQLQENNVHYKRFTSNIDLQPTNHDLETDLSNSTETYQKLSKIKIKNKKRKAPPVPPLETSTNNRQNPDVICREMERKQRLFKTQSETIFQTSIDSVNRHPPFNTKTNTKPNPQAPENRRSSFRPKVNHQNYDTASPAFRREKSFDVTILSSRNKDAIHQQATELKSLQQSAAISSLPKKTDFKAERNDFKMELEAVTKCRLMKKNTYMPDSKPKTSDSSTRKKKPNSNEQKSAQLPTYQARPLKPETLSKIPQLKKTFYFGMEGSKRKTIDSSQKLNTNQSYDAQQMKKSESSPAKHIDDVYLMRQKYRSEINDNGIQVNVRPTLPRRQLEIPRFSPVAAWRTLSEEYRKQSPEPKTSPLSPNFTIEAANTFLIEDRIHRKYREPCPFYPDNKSGDSGISGDDAYLPEKPIQPRNYMHIQNDYDVGNLDDYPIDDLSSPLNVVGPFLTAWTPQQDLDEEDTSSDSDLAVKLVESQSQSSGHVFSLSLPRENQLSLYAEKSKPDFRSLQKLKRSVSGDLNDKTCECTRSSESNMFGNACLGSYCSDNWVLSKGVPPKNQQLVSASNQIDLNKKTNYMDLPVSIEPLSLGYLATGKHVMYLPNRPIKDFKRPAVANPTENNSTNKRDHTPDDSFGKNIRTRNKHFSFQSSVRQIDRRQIAEKLSKNAEQKEILRLSELEAMRRVEEEFKKKRADEKASIRQQLRLYLNDDNFTSLPADYSQHFNGFRAEPDGAVSSSSSSPILRINDIIIEKGSGPVRKNTTTDNENSCIINQIKLSLNKDIMMTPESA